MKTNFIVPDFKRLLLCAVVLLLTADSFAQSGGATFTTGPVMNRTRISPFMATLPDGRVAAFGGREYNFVSCPYADFYDPVTNTFTEIAMNYPHDYAYVVKLNTGKYYIIGGSMDLGVAPGYANTEIFDPVANTFTSSGTMNYARSSMGAAQMTTGKVLIAGAWYNTSGATYGETFDPVAATYTLTGAMNTPRSWPLVLPTNDSGAVVLGGMPPYGGSSYTSVEFYSSADNSFHALTSEIIPADPGWMLNGFTFHTRPLSDRTLTDGKFLIGAYRAGEYGLLTFDPATKTFAKIATSAPLMDALTNGGFYDMVLDKVSNIAYFIGVDSGYDPLRLSLVSVNLTTGWVYHPANTFTMPASEYLYPSMAFMPANGKILLEGISSTTGDYFHATDKTYILTPHPTLDIVNLTPKDGNAFPNPATDQLHFVLNPGTTDVTISIYDMTGRELSVSECSGQNITVPVNDLSPGIYIYEINNNGTVTRNKFVKQ